MRTQAYHSEVPHRPAQPAQIKLRPASQSYLLTTGQTGALTVIFGLAALLLGAHVWLIRLLG